MCRSCIDSQLSSVTGTWDHEGTNVTIPAQVVVAPKGGTVNRTWSLYLEHMTKNMFPDMKDELLYRFLVKTDMGPGRLDPETLRKGQKRGLHFKFGMPCGTSVNQEQDQLFG